MSTRVNINMCADASLFSSYQVGGTGALLMGNGSHAYVLGVGTVILFRKDSVAEERAACPLHQKESC